MATKAKKSVAAKKSSKPVKKIKSVKPAAAKKSAAAKPKKKKAITASRPTKAKKKLTISKPKTNPKKATAKKLSKPSKSKSESKVAASKKNLSATIANKLKVKAPLLVAETLEKNTSKLSKATEKKASFNKAKATPVVDDIIPYEEEMGEEYMNKNQQEHFSAILLQRKKEFMEEMERTVHHLQDEAANFPDPNDRATQEEEFGLVLRTRDRELKYIKNIEDALQRIEEGEYGYCEACGVEIGVKRLEARPTATLCIDCKTLDEIREKQMGG